MMSEEEIRKELAMGNIVCPECSDSLMNFEYDENDNCIYICPKCGYDIEAENYDYFFESELYNNDEYEDEPDAGCQACGGPYTQCKTSCDRFDD